MALIPGAIASAGAGGLFGLSAGEALLGSSLISGGSSLVGGKKGANAAKEAAQIQANAALASAALQQQRFEETKEQLLPFIDYGKGAIPIVQQLTGTGAGGDPLTAPLTKLPDKWDPSLEALKKTPGYQFTLEQGLQAAQNALTPGGGGLGAGSIAAATKYAEGLAQTTYGQEHDRWAQEQQLAMQGRSQTYNMLTGEIDTGLKGAGALGQVAVTSGKNVGDAIYGAGTASAGGVTGAAQALIGGQVGASNALTGPLQLAAMQQMGLFGQNYSQF